MAFSPLDDRYAEDLADFHESVGEDALTRFRCLVEIRWFRWLITRIWNESLSPDEIDFLDQISVLSSDDLSDIKKIEQDTQHDVKSVELFLRRKIKKHVSLSRFETYLHLFCTSDDINNIAYALMLKHVRQHVLLPQIDQLICQLRLHVQQYAHVPMLARTHGQPAVGTTVGKELANVLVRIERSAEHLNHIEIFAKMNGAVGNFNAHVFARPDIAWHQECHDFIKDLGLSCNVHTTQIEPHDWMVHFFHHIEHLNSVLIGFCRDMWTYIGLYYWRPVRLNAAVVGSSTMPHKVNPIAFEKAEGNLEFARSLCQFLSAKLPISRLQRDLTDSTVLRNIPLVIGHSMVAYRSLMKGLASIQLNEEAVDRDLKDRYEILSEAIQTLLRIEGFESAYEHVKQCSRGLVWDQQTYMSLVDDLDFLSAQAKNALKNLTPSKYVGLACDLSFLSLNSMRQKGEDCAINKDQIKVDEG